MSKQEENPELPGDWQKIYVRLCEEVKGRTSLALSKFKGQPLNDDTIKEIKERLFRQLMLMAVDGYFDGVVPADSLEAFCQAYTSNSQIVIADPAKRAVRVDLSSIYKFLHLCCWQACVNVTEELLPEEVAPADNTDAVQFLSLLVAATMASADTGKVQDDDPVC